MKQDDQNTRNFNEMIQREVPISHYTLKNSRTKNNRYSDSTKIKVPESRFKIISSRNIKIEAIPKFPARPLPKPVSKSVSHSLLPKPSTFPLTITTLEPFFSTSSRKTTDDLKLILSGNLANPIADVGDDWWWSDGGIEPGNEIPPIETISHTHLKRKTPFTEK